MTGVSTNKVNLARWLLRIGLAAVLLYASAGMLLQPDHWAGFMPAIVTHLVPAAMALKLFSFVQMVTALWLLSGWMTRYAAGLVALMMFGIVAANLASIEVTFRDVGLMLGAAALAVLS